MSKPRLEIIARVLPDGHPFTVTGRDAFALDELLAGGLKGCTPITRPAPRWSAFVHALRTDPLRQVDLWSGRSILVARAARGGALALHVARLRYR